MLNTITWIIIIIGLLLIVYSFVSFRRKGESEISESAISLPQFKIGVIMVVIAIIIKVILAFV